MHLKSILNHVEPLKSFVSKRERLVITAGGSTEIEVDIEPRAKSLRRHRHLLLNWFRAKGTISAGVVEGLNGVVKLTTRKAFGFRTSKGLEIPMFHGLGPAAGARINPQSLLRRHQLSNATPVLLRQTGS